MDWSRSCYASRWHLFADAPNITSAGKYYFTPAGVPFVGGNHFYGSRNWLESNWQPQQSLGEDLATKHTWYRGDQPAVVPNAEIVGSQTCIANGGNFSTAVGTAGMRDGFPIACFTPAVPLDPLWEIASSYNSCSLQFFYATVIEWMYLSDVASIQTAFAMLLGPTAVTTFHAGTPTLPAVVTVVTPSFTIIVMDGTQNAQQLALQAFYAIIGPQNNGTFASNQQQYAASTWAKDFMLADGGNVTGPVMLVGHSYGGAAVANLAARMRAWQPNRIIRRLTFGSPRVGDQRLRDLLQTTLGLSFVNAEDLVGTLPPTIDQIVAVATFLGLPNLFVWARWIAEPSRARMDINGRITFNADPVIDFPVLLDYTQKALLNQPISVILSHAITDYRQRVLKRCPAPEWPISLPLWLFLLGLQFPAYWGRDYWGRDYWGQDYWF